MTDRATEPFTGAAKVETFIKDFNRLRDLIRVSGDLELEAAWDRCERWVFCMTPNPKEPNK